MLLPCVLYALTTCLHFAFCVINNPSAATEVSRGITPQQATIAEERGDSGRRRTDSELGLHTQRRLWLPLRDVLPAQAALLPAAISNKVISSGKIAELLPSSTFRAVPTPTLLSHSLEDVAAASTVTETPVLRTQLRRVAPSNATATLRPPTTIRETTTVYVEPESCTGTPTPTSTMTRQIPISNAGQKGGIAGGTVGAVLIVAVLTLFCYRRVRRRTQNRRGFLSLSDSSSTSDAAERGMVAHGGLFGSDNKTASAAGSLVTDTPQTPHPGTAITTEGESTSEQVPICFRPSRRLIARYPSLPVTPTASIRLSSDYLNPVIRDTVLLPRPLRRPGMRTLTRSQSWQAEGSSHKQPTAAAAGGSGSAGGSRNRSRSTTVTSSSVYSSDATFDFAEYVTIDARTSRATATTQRASGTTDASGLRSSTLANFPRPPPFTFSRGDGRGLGTSWRESFVFSTPEDEVLLAFPKLARQIEEDLI